MPTERELVLPPGYWAVHGFALSDTTASEAGPAWSSRSDESGPTATPGSGPALHNVRRSSPFLQSIRTE